MKKTEESFEIMIGLETHITLNSKKKIFNWEDTYQGDISPNSKVGPWELGYLGVLPIINPEVIYLGMKLATALEMEVSKTVLFDRKIYNYFDLPKGYQITQQELPFATNGYLPVIEKGIIKKIPVDVIQLEEDTARSIYENKGIKLDFNRAGNPLIELVTKPVFKQVKTVLTFIKQLQNLLCYLEISQAKMEKGQLRVDLNFSLKFGNDYMTPRYEVKNLNSLTNIEKSLEYEINKHRLFFHQKKSPPVSQTLGFDEVKRITTVHREKTSYFYLPEFNIPPIKLKDKEIQKVKINLPKLPWMYWERVKQVDIQAADELIKNPFLIKIFSFLERKKTFELKESKNWIIFYSNYLSPHLEASKFNLFTKRWKSYCALFKYWKEKKLDNKEIREVAYLLLTTKKRFSFLVKKYEKNAKINKDLIEKELEKLWNTESVVKFTDQQKIQNYLVGRVKKTFSDCPVPEIVLIIKAFIRTKKKHIN